MVQFVQKFFIKALILQIQGKKSQFSCFETKQAYPVYSNFIIQLKNVMIFAIKKMLVVKQLTFRSIISKRQTFQEIDFVMCTKFNWIMIIFTQRKVKYLIAQIIQLVINKMKTQTQVTLQIRQIVATENLFVDPSGFIIKVFFSSSRVDTRIFKVDNQIANINQTIKIKSIIGNQLEFWLSIPNGKIIAFGSIPLKTQGQASIDLKMCNTDFGKLNVFIQNKVNPIEKEVYVEPDQQLLKKVEDPIEKIRKQQLQKRKIKEEADRLEAIRAKKKPAITLTHYDKKDEPFI